MIRVIAELAVLAALVLADEANNPPRLPAELQTRLALAALHSQQAQAQAKAAAETHAAALAEAAKVCGEAFAVSDSGTAIVCAPKARP